MNQNSSVRTRNWYTGRGFIGVGVLLVMTACTTATPATSLAPVAPPSTATTSTTAPTETTSANTTLTTTASTTTSVPPEPTSITGRIGVVGCSNTDLAVSGYDAQSTLQLLTPGDLGGGSARNWGDPSSQRYSDYWGLYMTRRPAGGYEGAWIQLCIRANEHGGAFDEDEQEWVSQIVEEVQKLDPTIPIWVSGVNSYEDGLVCSSIGVDGPAIADATADWAVSNLDVLRGPELGPLQPDHIGVRDDCHPNKAGQIFLGGQLVSFFDR